MSTEESLDPELIEQTKQQIRSLVGEIAQLSKSELAPDTYYEEFLPRVVSALAAVGGAIWTTNDEGRLALQYQIKLHETRLSDSQESMAQHGRLLYKTLESEGLLVPPHSGAGEADQQQGANPTDFLLVLGPLKTDLEAVGVVEIFQRPEAGPKTQRGYLRFLMQMCELAGDFLNSQQLRHFSDRQALWTRLEDFAHTVHAGLEPRETAYTIANEGRRLIECDRLSVAICKGRKCRIEAVSGQDLFDKRSNTVRLLGKLATAVVATGDPVWYTGDTSDMPPQVEDAVQEYVDESHSKTVAVLPLKRPPPPGEEEPDKHREPESPIGALLVEQIEDSRVPPSMVQRVDVVCRHSSTALANALEHQNLFLMPLWRFLGKTRWILRARTLPKTLTVTGVIVGLLLALMLWPADFELESKGTLEPVEYRKVFVGIDGVVDGLFVEHGDFVCSPRTKDKVVAAVGALFRGQPRHVDDAFLQALSETLRRSGVAEQTAEEIVEQVRTSYADQPLNPEDALEIVAGKLTTLLLKLRNTDLDVAIEKVVGDLATTQEEIDSIISRLGERGLSDRDRKRLHGEWSTKLEQQRSLEHQLTLHNEKKEKLSVLSPTDGQIVTWDLRHRLVNRPVKRGDELMEVANTDGRWRLELHMAEDRMGHIARAQNELREKLRLSVRAKLRETLGEVPDEVLQQQVQEKMGQPRQQLCEFLGEDLNDELKVTFILATDPGTEHVGTVEEIEQNAEVRGEEGNTVLIRVNIDEAELANLRPGASVTAKVYCGRRSIGYCWFHDLIAFIQSRILFRF